MANNLVLREAIEVISVGQEKPPPWLQGVPCLVERNPTTGAQRAHYGTACIKAMEWLSTNHKPGGDMFISAGSSSTAFDSFDAPLDGSGTVASGNQVNGGCLLDDLFDFPKEYTNAPGRVAETDVQSLMALRTQQENKRGTAPPRQVSFLEPEQKLPSVEELRLQRMRADTMQMNTRPGQRQL